MRISDWSSDVCSSDLTARGGGSNCPPMAKRRSPPPLKRAPDSPKMRRWPLLLSMLAASPAAAQPAVTSLAPEKVSVSVFRGPGRDEGGEVSPNWREGFALIPETRTVDCPAGESTVRLGGGAAGMIAGSALGP